MLGTVIHLQFCANGSWDSLFPTATANIKALGQLQTYEPRTLFSMTSLQYFCILGLAEIKTLHPRDKKCAKDAGCSLTKSLWVILHAFLSSAVYFSKSPFSKIISLSNYLDPDQDQQSVWPDLGANCLQLISARDFGLFL